MASCKLYAVSGMVRTHEECAGYVCGDWAEEPVFYSLITTWEGLDASGKPISRLTYEQIIFPREIGTESENGESVTIELTRQLDCDLWDMMTEQVIGKFTLPKRFKLPHQPVKVLALFTRKRAECGFLTELVHKHEKRSSAGTAKVTVGLTYHRSDGLNWPLEHFPCQTVHIYSPHLRLANQHPAKHSALACMLTGVTDAKQIMARLRQDHAADMPRIQTVYRWLREFKRMPNSL